MFKQKAYELHTRILGGEFSRHSTFLDDEHSIACAIGMAELLENKFRGISAGLLDLHFKTQDRELYPFEKPGCAGGFYFVKIVEVELDKKEYDRYFAKKYPENLTHTCLGLSEDGSKYEYTSKTYRQDFLETYGEEP